MESPSLQTGEMVGPYKIVRKIGQGGMGEVFEAFEESLQLRIAVKILTAEASGQPDLVKRFKTEGRALARLEHGHTVRVHTLGDHNGRIYIAMEYIDGWTLDEYMRTHYFALDEILRLARHMLEGLAAAHSAGIVHRDIKPQNIMVDRQLNTKLLDFGIAKINGDKAGVDTVTGVIFGTLNYIAPEIFNGLTASKQSDIYSLGLVLFSMFSGKAPITGRTRLEVVEKVATTRVVFGPELNTILPATLKRVIYKMIAKNLDERYTSARDALSDLEKVNLSALPADLRPALSSHMNIECPEELRTKCSSIGLEYFEIRLVVCLAAQITLRAQTWVGQDKVIITSQALTEAARRYVSAKRQMIVRNAYRNSNFMTAVGGLVVAVLFAVFAVAWVLNSERQKPAMPVADLTPPPPPESKAEPKPVPLPAVKPIPASKPVAVQSKPIVVAKPAAKPRAVTKKPVAAKKVVKRQIVAKKTPPPARAPARAHYNSDPAAQSEPDFLQQKPVLLPTVVDRRSR